MKALTRTHADPIPFAYTPDRLRAFTIGAKYKANAGTSYCFIDCGKGCDPSRGARCWQRRAEAGMVYRLRKLVHNDFGQLGRAYLVTLVKPDEWQFRAFTMGGPSMRLPRERWHEATGLVWEAELGEEVL